MFKVALKDIDEKEIQSEDNLYYILQLHKNIASSMYYEEVVPDDPVS